METIKTLGDNLGKATEEIRHVNRGGCGFAALQLFLALKRAGKNPKIAAAGKWAHVMIVLDGCFLDATGFIAENTTDALHRCAAKYGTRSIRTIKLSSLRKEAKRHWFGWSAAYNHEQDADLATAIKHAVKLTFAQPGNVD